MITAWDPGDTTGWAVWDEEGNLLKMGMCALEDIPDVWDDLLTQFDDEGANPMRTVIVEDFVLFGKRAQSQTGSRMKASQGIGSLRTLARQERAEFILQPASVKSIAIKWSGITMPSDHDKTHEWDAFLHGYHWLVKQKRIQTQLEIEKGVTR